MSALLHYYVACLGQFAAILHFPKFSRFVHESAGDALIGWPGHDKHIVVTGT